MSDKSTGWTLKSNLVPRSGKRVQSSDTDENYGKELMAIWIPIV